MAHPKYRADIDGLRAVAVLAVVLFHAFPTWLPGGFTGVDVFFVISGFLIATILSQSLEAGTFSLTVFYARRIRRIFPALLLVLLACLIVGWWVLLPEELAQLGKQTAGGAAFIANLLFWQESGYFDAAADTKPLLHLWSLGIEEQFYILWPCVLWLAWRLRQHLKEHLQQHATLWATLALLIGSFALNAALYRSHAVADFYAPFTRFWELLLGGLLAVLPLKPTPGARAPWFDSQLARNSLAATGLLLILAGFGVVHAGRLFPGFWALLPTIGAMLLLWAGPSAALNRTLLSNPLLGWVGMISYPLYLWHWPLLSFARILVGETPSASIRCACVALAVLLAWSTTLWVERPLRFGGRGVTKALGLSAVMLVIGVAGLATYFYGGFPQRAHIQALQAQALDLTRTKAATSTGWICTDPLFKEGYCSLDEERPPTAVMLGDSHAQSLYWGLRPVVRDLGGSLALVGSNGCTPFTDLATELTIHERKRGCIPRAQRVVSEILQNPEIGTVIVALRNVPYITGTGFGEIEKDSTTAVWLAEERPGVRTQAAAFAIALDRFLKTMTQTNKQVVFVHDIPELGFDIKRCLDQRPSPFKVGEKPCTLPRQLYEQRYGEFRTLANEVLRRYLLVTVIDASAVLCDADVCSVKQNGRLLYEDDDHLSNYGADYVAERMKTPLAETLRR